MTSLEEQRGHAVDPRFPPGTIFLEDLQHATGEGGSGGIILQPTPTSDPNDPRNWSSLRKGFNYGLVLLYVLFTFVQLDIAFTSWGQIQDELGFSIGHLNGSTALGYAGLGIGSIFFIPLMHKYGRRPMYILSSTMQLGGVIWLARLQTVTDLWLGNLLAGLGGAVCETIVQVTISDVFFVHQHASMNALYMLATCMGAYLGPVAAGYVVEAQGWRWIWWWCVILLGTQLLFTIFCFEESKYTTILINGRPEGYEHQPQDQDQDQDKPDDSRREEVEDDDADTDIKKNFFQRMDRTLSHRFIDYNLPKNSYKKRMALITPTSGPIWNNPLVPFRVFSFYAIAYTALVFGSILALFSILTSVQAAYMYGPPWNFSSQGVGLMNVAPFIGSIFGAYVGGHLSDQSIVWLAKRNGGIYEPEMRLWFALPSIILAPASVLMLGLGLAYGVSWPLLAVGFGVFGFVMAATCSIALAYAMDCYGEVIGTAMIGIIFTRNVFAVGVLFALNPWIEAVGLRDFHITIAVIVFVILLLPLPLLKWGKAARVKSAPAYRAMLEKDAFHRA